MARYSAFLGRRVEVHYRAGDIVLPASGTFAADSGKSIFLEQRLIQHGQQKNFRWEIPYQYIVRLEEAKEEPPAEKGRTPVPAGGKSSKCRPGTAQARSAAAAGEPPPPFGSPPKTA
jgi:hypothetical protein